jgi:hypothetical protein
MLSVVAPLCLHSKILDKPEKLSREKRSSLFNPRIIYLKASPLTTKKKSFATLTSAQANVIKTFTVVIYSHCIFSYSGNESIDCAGYLIGLFSYSRKLRL